MNWWRRYDDLVHRVLPIVGGVAGMAYTLVAASPGTAVVTFGPVAVDAFYCALLAFGLWFCLGVWATVVESDRYDHLP